jgi:hypothetical protein
MHMLRERLQLLVSTDQRRRLEREAQRRGTSVASVIRDAVDAQLGGVTPDDRRVALDGIRALHGRFASPEDLNRLVEQEREAGLDALARRVKR